MGRCISCVSSQHLPAQQSVCPLSCPLNRLTDKLAEVRSGWGNARTGGCSRIPKARGLRPRGAASFGDGREDFVAMGNVHFAFHARLGTKSLVFCVAVMTARCIRSHSEREPTEQAERIRATNTPRVENMGRSHLVATDHASYYSCCLDHDATIHLRLFFVVFLL